jgi:hypothetical protein
MKKFLAFLGLGVLGGLIVAHIYVQGFFISWKKLADLPEKPKEILAVNEGVWIKTELGHIYHYPSDEAFPFVPIECDKDCWQKYETAPANEKYISDLSGCGMHAPSTKWLVDSISVCQSFGPAAIAFIYGFDKNGRAYYWLHPLGDMDTFAYFAFPVQGGIYALVISIVWLVISDFYDRIKKSKMPINYDNLSDN